MPTGRPTPQTPQSSPKRLRLTGRHGFSREILEDRACQDTLDAALRVHEALGSWHAADTYKNALAVDLLASGLRAHRNASVSVIYRGQVVGALDADLLVEDRVLVVVRADPRLEVDHKLDVLRGIAASGIRLGLVCNFGLPELAFARLC